MNGETPRNLLLGAFGAAVDAARPEQVLAAQLPPRPTGHTVVVGAGKAALSMALALEAAWAGPLSGVVVVPYGQAGGRTQHIRVLEASHPVPDEAGVRATARILAAVTGLSRDDLVLCLISGGGSALLSAPWGVTLAEKAALTGELLASGASIQQINAVRKHLSRVKGGQLARAGAPARVVSLIVSDVVGDDPGVIASGPTAPDRSTFAEALLILERYGVQAPRARRHLLAGAQGELPETPGPGDPVFERVENRLIVTGRAALGAARGFLEGRGLRARVLSDQIEGPAVQAARAHARAAKALAPGEALLSGGETTTIVKSGAGSGPGRGGRNLEFTLALALELEGAPIYALAADTDGIDGSSFAAGAVLTPDSLRRARDLGLNARAFLHNSDAHGFFERLGDLVVSGPTGTNVNDLRLIVRI